MTTQITKTSEGEYKALTVNIEAFKRALGVSAAGGQGLSIGDLTRITTPSGSSPAAWAWDGKAVDNITGIILYAPYNRAMWLTPLSQGNGGPAQQPDCKGAPDPQTGYMTGSRSRQWIDAFFNASEYAQKPAELLLDPVTSASADKLQTCDSCPFAQFGTAQNGRSQYCSLKQNLYILVPGEAFPVVLVAAAMSIKPARQYLQVELLKKLLTADQVETKISLVKEGKGTQAYYKLVFEMVRELTPAEKSAVQDYAAAFVPVIERSNSARPQQLPTSIAAEDQPL